MILILVQRISKTQISNMRIEITLSYMRAAMVAIGEANRVVNIAA
jgi:hypothetical protein